MTDYAIMPLTDYQNICNSVRAKTGKSEVLKSGDLSGEIESISGGGNPFEAFESLRSFELSPNSTITEFVANLPNVTKLNYSFAVARTNPLTRIELTISNKLTNVSFMLGNAAALSLTEIVFKGDFSKVKSVASAFSCGGSGINDALKKIVGLDFTSVTNASNVFGSQRGLTDIEIKANTVNVSLDFSYQPHLNIASCVNVLNALKDRTGQDALTLKLNAALKTADTGRIYANYVKLDTDTNLYVSCESTDEGAMTMADAITSKNWTIA